MEQTNETARTNQKGGRRKFVRRFIKSYKYKHKKAPHTLPPPPPPPTATTNTMSSSCDQDAQARLGGGSGSGGGGTSWLPRLKQCSSARNSSANRCDHPIRSLSSARLPLESAAGACQKSNSIRRKSRIVTNHSGGRPTIWQLVTPMQLLLLFLLFSGAQLVYSFCPYKCVCNDHLLSANCTHTQTISFVPMTLNPQLKRLTLNHLPISELTNSLSIYHQLESLDLHANQLRQIKYENFNFRAPPHSVLLAKGSSHHQNSHHQGAASVINHQQLNEHNQQFARNLKQALDKSLLAAHTSATSTSGMPSSSSSSSPSTSLPSSSLSDAALSINADEQDEIRFHLRELDLSNNQIEYLGQADFSQEPLNEDTFHQDSPAKQTPPIAAAATSATKTHHRLKSQQLESSAPFLTLTRLEMLNLRANKLTKLRQHAFLGLVQLKVLDLSWNSLEHIDRHAFVGLISLEQLDLSHNRLAGQLNALGLTFCRAPTNELRRLDLSHNLKVHTTSRDNEQVHPTAALTASINLNSTATLPDGGAASSVVLPNQMFICAPKLADLQLQSIQLRYIQVNAFDNLRQLQTLNLSGNLLEQVPADSFGYMNSNLSSSLQNLDLSENLIEFVQSRQNSFRSLNGLRWLRMSAMPRLVSFDLASLMIIGGKGESNNVNYDLERLELGQNARLQSFYSSIERINFKQLRWLDLNGALELAEIELDKMIDLLAGGRSDRNLYAQSQLAQQLLHVDLSGAPNLNCTSCKMRWLIEAVQVAGAAAGTEPSHVSPNLFATFDDRNIFSQAPNPSQPLPKPNNDPFQRPFPSPEVANVGWNLVPIEPQFNIQNVPQQSASSNGLHGASARSQRAEAAAARIRLISSEFITCSWPFNMPLEELIKSGTNFGSIFAHCDDTNYSPATINGVERGGQNDISRAQTQLDIMQSLRNYPFGGNIPEQQHEQYPFNSKNVLQKNQLDTTKATTPTDWVLSDSFALASTISIICLVLVIVVGVGKFVALVIARRHYRCKWRSPSSTTTSIDSPDCSSSSSASAAGNSGKASSSLIHGLRQNHRRHLCNQQKQVPMLLSAGMVADGFGDSVDGAYGTATATTTNGLYHHHHNHQRQVQLHFSDEQAHSRVASRLVSATSKQIERRAHRSGNLLSRFVSRLSFRGSTNGGGGGLGNRAAQLTPTNGCYQDEQRLFVGSKGASDGNLTRGTGGGGQRTSQETTATTRRGRNSTSNRASNQASRWNCGGNGSNETAQAHSYYYYCAKNASNNSNNNSNEKTTSTEANGERWLSSFEETRDSSSQRLGTNQARQSRARQELEAGSIYLQSIEGGGLVTAQFTGITSDSNPSSKWLRPQPLGAGTAHDEIVGPTAPTTAAVTAAAANQLERVYLSLDDADDQHHYQATYETASSSSLPPPPPLRPPPPPASLDSQTVPPMNQVGHVNGFVYANCREQLQQSSNLSSFTRVANEETAVGGHQFNSSKPLTRPLEEPMSATFSGRNLPDGQLIIDSPTTESTNYGGGGGTQMGGQDCPPPPEHRQLDELGVQNRSSATYNKNNNSHDDDDDDDEAHARATRRLSTCQLQQQQQQGEASEEPALQQRQPLANQTIARPQWAAGWLQIAPTVERAQCTTAAPISRTTNSAVACNLQYRSVVVEKQRAKQLPSVTHSESAADQKGQLSNQHGQKQQQQRRRSRRRRLQNDHLSGGALRAEVAKDEPEQTGGSQPPLADGGQRAPSDGHIYVTLDGPIKQRNGCADEYKQSMAGQGEVENVHRPNG